MSRPGCKVCAEMGDNLACGLCIKLSDTAAVVVRKRRDVVKRAFKTAGPIPTGQPSRRATLRCSQGHTWQSYTSPGKDDTVEEPQCDICNEYFVTINMVKGILDESKACTDSCKKAINFKCICSCAGAAHGIDALGKKAS
jgi:hypothetical protein